MAIPDADHFTVRSSDMSVPSDLATIDKDAVLAATRTRGGQRVRARDLDDIIARLQNNISIEMKAMDELLSRLCKSAE